MHCLYSTCKTNIFAASCGINVFTHTHDGKNLGYLLSSAIMLIHYLTVIFGDNKAFEELLRRFKKKVMQKIFRKSEKSYTEKTAIKLNKLRGNSLKV